VNIFTCGPSVYQKAHLGNFRTFLFEDILVRYLEYLGYKVKRGMNFTDIDDKAIEEAKKENVSLRTLTERNINEFLEEASLLGMRIPNYLPKASNSIGEAVEIIERLLRLNIAYWHGRNIYFDALKFNGFGKLYGLDLTKWPQKKRRFHKDTYPGMRWNLGDFILWHGYKKGDKIWWQTRIGKGRPAWNIQDGSMIVKYFDETLSIYCGGMDNLYRHHDYTLAILESIKPYPMAKFWLHCHHLYIDGQKMSKSKGNIIYTDTLLNQGYRAQDIRFFLIYGQYRDIINYSEEILKLTSKKLEEFKQLINILVSRGEGNSDVDKEVVQEVKKIFINRMDNDLDVKGAFDDLYAFLSKTDIKYKKPSVALGIIKALREVDKVLKVFFKRLYL
jgi:cysteinyl-tRNA synthetase